MSGMIPFRVKQAGVTHRPIVVSLVQLNVKLCAGKEPVETDTKKTKRKILSSFMTGV